jgi:hypothetical protein
MYVVTAVIIYLMCFTNLIPNQMKSMLKQPLLKVSALAGIAYLSTKNFEGALMLTIIFFATITCSSSNLESFNLLEKTVDPEDDQKITYSLNPMSAAISTSSNDNTSAFSVLNQGVYGEADKQMLIGIGRAKNESRLYDGRCYRAPVSVDAVAEATSSVADKATSGDIKGTIDVVAGFFGGNSNETFDPNNKVIENFEVTNPRCGTNLIEVDKCAVNENGYPTDAGEHFKACAAAYAKKEIQTCQFTNAEGKCLDEAGGSIVDNCDDPNSSLCEAPKIASTSALESTTGPFESYYLDSIKNTYLLNIPDKTRAKMDAEGNIEKRNTTVQKTVNVGTTESPILKPLYKVNDLAIPEILVGATTDVPIRKLNSMYEYVYEWDEPSAEESTVVIKIKNIQDPQQPKISIDDITAEQQVSYFLPGNEKVTNSEGKFINANGNTTNEDGSDVQESEAVDRFHPKFQNPVMETETVYVTEDLYSYVQPFDAGVSLDRFTYKPADLETYKTALTTYSENKRLWENSTAKKIMRTIGCHRLRNQETELYGYWNSETGSCAYQPIAETAPVDSSK